MKKNRSRKRTLGVGRSQKTEKTFITSSLSHDQRRYLYNSVNLGRARQLHEDKIIQIKEDNHTNKYKVIFNFWIKRTTILLLLAVVIIFVIRIVQLTPQVQISITNNNGSQSVAGYQSLVNKYLSSNWLDNNKITFNKNSLISLIKGQFPDVKTVKIKTSWFSSRITVSITIYQSQIFLSTIYNAGVVNSSGKVISLGHTDMNSMAVVNYPVNIRLKIGTNILTSQDIYFIETVNYELNLKKIKVNQFLVQSGAEELDAYIQSTPSYYVKFNLISGDALQQTGTYLALIHNLSLSHISPNQYIDVRIDGRAYYK